MRRVVASFAALMVGSAAVAAEPPLQVSYPGDAQMDCTALTTEIGRMETIMGISNDQAAKAQGTARAAEIGASVGINAALYSGALGSVPGLGMFGNAAAAAAKRAAAAKEAAAKEQIRTAEMRRSMLMGIHAGKSCGVAQATPVAAPAAPAAAPAATPAAAPVAAPAAAPAATPAATPSA